MGLFSNFFKWIRGFFKRRKESKEERVEEKKEDEEEKERKSEIKDIGSKLENIEAKLKKSEENIEAEEGFQEATIVKEEVELDEVEEVISKEKAAEERGDSTEIKSAKQNEEGEVNKLKKHLANLNQWLAQFEAHEKTEFGELEGKTKELRELIRELTRAETSDRFSSEKNWEKEINKRAMIERVALLN